MITSCLTQTTLSSLIQNNGKHELKDMRKNQIVSNPAIQVNIPHGRITTNDVSAINLPDSSSQEVSRTYCWS